MLSVHGWPLSGATYRKLLPHLVDHVTCHLVDLPSAGSSRFDASTELSIARHIQSVRRIVDILEFDKVAMVGHDSGGLIARHAMVGDPRLAAMGLIDTEPPSPGWRFRSFIASRRAPGYAQVLGWAAGMVDDREWFIQKAIAWWLRDLSKHDPDRVRAFLDSHGPRLKPFVRKEAATYL